MTINDLKVGSSSERDHVSLLRNLNQLYSYRSAIAHGGTYDFKGKTLESEEKAGQFIDILLRRIIVQALKEPQLLVDLKEC